MAHTPAEHEKRAAVCQSFADMTEAHGCETLADMVVLLVRKWEQEHGESAPPDAEVDVLGGLIRVTAEEVAVTEAFVEQTLAVAMLRIFQQRNTAMD